MGSIMGSNGRLLVVEDDPDIREMIAVYLGDDFTVRAAANATQALRLLAAESFDILLIDLELPGISGIDLVRALRARGIRTPVLMTSAAIDGSWRAHEADAAFLAKPFDLDRLEETIDDVLDTDKPIRLQSWRALRHTRTNAGTGS